MSRKYEKYLIKVTFLDNSIENIQYEGINTSSYKEMLKLYNDIKSEYTNKAKQIDFIGISKDGQLKIMFTKPIVSKKPTLVDELKDVLQRIEDRKTQLSDINSILDKEINSTNHDIEDIPYKCIGYSKEDLNNYKIELVDKILKASIDRRDAKIEYMSLETITSNIPIKSINNADKLLHKEFNLETKKDTTTVYSTTYNSLEERDIKINELNYNYQKVVDMGNGIIKYCNFVYKKSKNKINTNNIKNIYNNKTKLPKNEGISIKIKLHSENEKQHWIKYAEQYYESYNVNQDEKYIELINRKKGA